MLYPFDVSVRAAVAPHDGAADEIVVEVLAFRELDGGSRRREQRFRERRGTR